MTHKANNGGGPRHPRGLTLLEMLIVVFILSAIAMSVVSLTDGVDQQYRFEDTRSRRDRVRQAVVFDSGRNIAGQPLVAGFAADLGRLPNRLDELVDRGVIPLWQYNATANQWAGWRGPYLDAVAEPSTGRRAFRDGWGNVDLIAANDPWYFGWNFSVDQLAGTLRLQSYGADGVANGAPGAGSGLYDADYPPAPNNPLINAYDYRLNLMAWEVWVELRNDLGGKAKLPDDIRLRLYYPRENASGGFDWPQATFPNRASDRDAAEFLSLTAKTKGELNPGESKTVQVKFSKPNVDKFIPAGLRTFVVLEEKNNESIYNPDGNNSPQTIMFVPHAMLPISSKLSPLIIWEAD